MSDEHNAPRTLGDLIRTLEDSEEAFRANSQTAERHAAKGSSGEAMWWRNQAAVLRFQPDPKTMPGIDRIEILCDLEGAGSGLTSANVRRLRARLCTETGFTVEQVNALPLADAADAIQQLKGEPAGVAHRRTSDSGPRLLQEFRRALAEFGSGNFIVSVLKPPHQLTERPTLAGRMLGSMWFAGHATTKGQDLAFMIHYSGSSEDRAAVEQFKMLAAQAGSALTSVAREAIQLGSFESPQAAWCAYLLALPRAEERGLVNWSNDVGFIFNAFAASAYVLEEPIGATESEPAHNELEAESRRLLAACRAAEQEQNKKREEARQQQDRKTALERAFIAVRGRMPEGNDHEQSARAYATLWAQLAHLIAANPDLVHCPLENLLAEAGSPKAYALRFVAHAKRGDVATAAKMLLASWEAAPKLLHADVLHWLQGGPGLGLEAEIMGRSSTTVPSLRLSEDDLPRYRLALDRAIRAWGQLANHVRARLTGTFRRAHGVVLNDGFSGGPDIPCSFSAACNLFRAALCELHEFDDSPPDFPWPQWGEIALALTGPLPHLDGWLDSLLRLGKGDWQQRAVGPFLEHLSLVSLHFQGLMERLDQAKEEMISGSENAVATRLRTEKAIRQALAEEHKRVEEELARRRSNLDERFGAALQVLNLTTESVEEWVRRVTAMLISVGEEVKKQVWEDWLRESAEGDHLVRGLVEQMLDSDQAGIDAVVRELRDMPTELSHVVGWLKSLRADWSRVFDQGWLWWTLNHDLPSSPPNQPPIAAPQTEVKGNLGAQGTDPDNVAQPARATSPTVPHVASVEELEVPEQQPTIGIITALPLETAAVRAVFGDPPRIDLPGLGAGRAYWLVEIASPLGGVHRVAIAQADMGNNHAAVRASLLLTHFPNIPIIMCGIAGGMPNPTSPSEHVRLGDVVISNQKGVVQYDFVKRRAKRWEEIRASPHRPSARLLEAVRILESDRHLHRYPWEKALQDALARLRWERPDPTTDVLADTVDSARIVQHPGFPDRRPGQPWIFLGPIASANTLLKDPVKRDALRVQFGVRAVEMEGSGIQDATWFHEVGYLVVRGICDYCDSKKNDIWHRYAALAAAAYVRALLEGMPGAPSAHAE